MIDRACQAVGIDLGTTYSALAYMDSKGTPRVVCDGEGRSVVPSVIYFDEEEIIVGEMAVSQMSTDAARVAQFVKVHMGETWRQKFNGVEHTPESLSALIITHLLNEAEPQIGPIPSAVITVPAAFNERRRRATQQAGEIAGINVIGTLNEPMAATLSYGLYQSDQTQNAVVYDLGGGTFDVTIVRISPNSLEELSTNGNRALGGKDWDQALTDYYCDQFLQKHGANPTDDQQALQDIRSECEQAKRRLTRLSKTTVVCNAFGQSFKLEITRDLFESLTKKYIQATKLTTELALEDAKLTWNDVDRVVLVGGSTHMPAVRQMLAKAKGEPPDSGVNPVLAVALGAAIYARMVESGQEIQTQHLPPEIEADENGLEMIDDSSASEETLAVDLPQAKPHSDVPDSAPILLPDVSFVTAHGVGVRLKSAGAWQNCVLIPKNSRVPTQTTRRFNVTGKSTGSSSIRIEITQGDSSEIELTEPLGTGRIVLPARIQPGSAVDVTMQFDEQGRLHTHALHVETGQDMQMAVEVEGCLQEADVEAYRQFVQQSGFREHFSADDAMAELEMLDDDDDDEPPMIEML